MKPVEVPGSSSSSIITPAPIIAEDTPSETTISDDTTSSTGSSSSPPPTSLPTAKIITPADTPTKTPTTSSSSSSSTSVSIVDPSTYTIHEPKSNVDLSETTKSFVERHCDLSNVKNEEWYPTTDDDIWRQRAPYFIIAGVWNSGINPLANVLLKHPQIDPAKTYGFFLPKIFNRYILFQQQSSSTTTTSTTSTTT